MQGVDGCDPDGGEPVQKPSLRPEHLTMGSGRFDAAQEPHRERCAGRRDRL